MLLSLSEGAVFSVRDYDKKIRNAYHLRTIVGKYPDKRLEETLRSFVYETRPGRLMGTPGHQNAVSFIIDHIKKNDEKNENLLVVDEFSPDFAYAKKFYQDDFEKEIVSTFKPDTPEYKKWKRFTDTMIKNVESFKEVKGKNIVWEKKGSLTPQEMIILGAHYDSVAFDPDTFELKREAKMPGADDNASGVVALLSLIEILSEMDIPKTVRIVFFDFQEFGFLGSRAFLGKYAEELSKVKVDFYLNVEMIGHDSRIDDKKKKNRNMKIYVRKKDDKGHFKEDFWARHFIQFGKYIGADVDFSVIPNGFQSSDHINFWEAGFHALALTQDWDNDFNWRRNHTSNDFPETLNMKTYFATFQNLSAGVLAWAYDLKIN